LNGLQEGIGASHVAVEMPKRVDLHQEKQFRNARYIVS